MNASKRAEDLLEVAQGLRDERIPMGVRFEFATRRLAEMAKAELDAPAAPKLTVWYGSMPESNGRTNWTAILHAGKMMDGVTLDRSQYPHRVRYEADRVRFLLGELAERPWILDYDGDELTPCHLCGGTGEKDGKPCWGLNFKGTVHSKAVTGNAAERVPCGSCASDTYCEMNGCQQPTHALTRSPA